MSDARSWADLPDGILNLIRRKLLWEDYSNFRATCRNWNFRAFFDHVIYEKVKSAFLLGLPRSGNDSSCCCCEAYSPAYDKSFYVRASSELVGAKIHCSNYGWLLLSTSRRIFFYHPSTENTIHLPDITSEVNDSFDRMSFSASPTSPDCIVFGLADSYYNKRVYISFIRRGQQSWKNYINGVPNMMSWTNASPLKLNTSNIKMVRVKSNTYRVNLERFPSIGNFLWSNSSSSPVFHKGRFYCLGQDGRLGVFNPNAKKESMRWRLLDATKRPAAFMDNPRNMAYLLECNGELISIVVGPIGEFVRIYKFFNLTYSWQVVDDLKDQMVFCSPTGCVALTSNEARGTGLENTVHFPRFHERRHVFYSLSTEQFHSFEPGYPSIDFCDTKLLLNRTWMIPSFQFFSLQQLHWSSKPKKQLTSKKDADVGHHHIHPHYVIRSLTFRSSGDPSACAELEDYEKGRKQESPTTQAFLVLSNHEGERMLVNLATGSAVSHSRIIGLEARMRGKKVYSSAHGLLVLMDHEARSCSLLDPVSMVETTSPTWERRFDCLFVVLHLPPGESKFVVMVFGVAKSDREIEGTESNLEAKNDALAMLWRDGDSEWTILTTPSEQGVEFNAVAVLNLGKIYGYLVMKSELVSVELQPETYITRVLPELDYPDFPKGADTMVISLVECRGEILLFVRYDALGYETPRLRVVMDMQVYKMDMEMMRWIRIDDLGDLAFLWSNTWGCYPCHASKSGLKRNSVYFFQPKEKYLYRFDCGDGSISVSKPYPDLDDSWSPNEFIMWDNQIL